MHTRSLLELDFAIFCRTGSRPVGRMWSTGDKSLEIPCHGRGSWIRATGTTDTFILPLSYHDPGHREDRQWDAVILPLSYHDPGHREERHMRPPIELSWPGPQGGQTHAPSHWAIITRATGRTDTCVLPLSYHDPGHREDRHMRPPIELSWPGPQGGQTVIHSFSHWAVMTQATGKADTFILPLSYHDWTDLKLLLSLWPGLSTVRAQLHNDLN